MTLYVDDVYLLGKDVEVPGRIKHTLMGRFSMSGVGDVSIVLRMEVVGDCERKTVNSSQKSYAMSPLDR